MAKHVENYEHPDPFGYKASSDDWLRREIVRAILEPGEGIYSSALDLGAGEGWITEHLPVYGKWGYDVSADAMRRFPATVLKFDPVLNTKRFDLICAMGVLYPFYDTEPLTELMRRHKHKGTHFLIAGIPEWEQGLEDLMRSLGVGLVKSVDIRPYRKYTCQRIRLYKP